ncbi:MAG: hypothetical protein WBD40_09110 [Tepidisphaeraceae bacterium]
MGCFTWLLLLIGFVFVMVSLIRWFEQATEAVELGWWSKVFVLLAMPFTVWFFPSRVSAGRPTLPPRHEPVRGFGSLPKGGIVDPSTTIESGPHPGPLPEYGSTALTAGRERRQDAPPPGTPPEFLVKPTPPPPKPKGARPSVDPEKLAKLRQKMREQGMLDDDSE